MKTNPFPGLAPFDERDAARFFGRDREIEEILERLASRRLLAVIGVSGCGKSSLVRAGVIPVLRFGAAEDLPGHWRIHTITPGNAPLDALRRTMAAPATWPATSFDLVGQARGNLRPGENLLLIVDQFEELFSFRAGSLDKDAGNAAAMFVNLLLNAVDQKEVPIYILLTMRTDFLGECAQFRGLPEALNDCYYLVPRMTRTQQQEAIERPLEEQGVVIAPALAQRLLNDSAEDPDHLPVLQHLLKRLWERWEERGEGGTIGDGDYEAVGGWKGAIDREAERVFAGFPNNKAGIQQVFQWITERGTGEKPVRRARSFAECAEVSGMLPERFSEIVHAFQDRGLLRPSDRSAGSPVDLPHESVMWQWSRLAGWIAEDADYGAQLRFLLQSTRQQQPLVGLSLASAAALCSGWRIQKSAALRYLREHELDEIDSWIVHSQGIEKAKRRRRVWTWAGIGSLATVLAAFALWISTRERNMAEARELSAWAAVSLRDDPERSLILGLYAWGKEHRMAPGLEQSLHDGLLQSQVRLTFHGHRHYVNCVAWSPDGSRLATASRDETVKVWDAGTGRELLTLRGHQDNVMSVAWSPDGSKLATASNDKTAKVWDAGTGRELLTLRGHQDNVMSVAWSPDGSKLATASFDETARVWESSTGRELLTLGHQNTVMSVAWSPDGSKLATASTDETARVWESSMGRELLTLHGHQNSVMSVAWSPDGTKLATGSRDDTAKVWEAGTGRELLTLRGHQNDVGSVAWSPDGSQLATASNDGTANVWESATGRQALSLNGHQQSVVSLAWSPDGTKLATGSKDDTAKVWEAGAGRELLTLRGHHDAVTSVSWSPEGGKLATSGEDHTASVWEAGTGRELLTLRGHLDNVRSVAWSSDGSKLATASYDKTARVWEAGTGRELLILRGLRGHFNTVASVAWSPDDSKVLTGSADYVAKVWDAGTGRVLLTLRGHHDVVASVAWSPDSTKLVTASLDNTVKVWEAGTGRELITLYDHQGAVDCVAWSPDGSKLVTGSRDNTAIVWVAGTSRVLLNLHGHHDHVTSVAWSPDSSKLATASLDKTVKVWESATGRELLTLRGHQASVWGVAWSPDGKRIASASEDGTAQIYAMDPVDLLRLVRSRITRELTSDECRRYLSVDRCPPLPRVP